MTKTRPMFKEGATVRFYHSGRWKTGMVTFKPRNRTGNYFIRPNDSPKSKQISYPTTHPSLHDAAGPKLVCVGGGFEWEKKKDEKAPAVAVTQSAVKQTIGRVHRRGQKAVVVEHAGMPTTGRVKRVLHSKDAELKALVKKASRKAPGKISAVGDEISHTVYDKWNTPKFDVSAQKASNEADTLGNVFVAASEAVRTNPELRKRGGMEYAKFDGMRLYKHHVYLTNLNNVSMKNATLLNVKMRNSRFAEVDAEGVDMQHCDFEFVDMARTIFSNGKIGASFGHVNLNDVRFNGAEISGDARFIYCAMEDTAFYDAVMQGVHSFTECSPIDVKISRLLATAVRQWSSYQFYLFQPEESRNPDDFIIKAGCQVRTMRSYRSHSVSINDGQRKVVETNDLLNYFDAVIATTLSESPIEGRAQKIVDAEIARCDAEDEARAEREKAEKAKAAETTEEEGKPKAFGVQAFS